MPFQKTFPQRIFTIVQARIEFVDRQVPSGVIVKFLSARGAAAAVFSEADLVDHDGVNAGPPDEIDEKLHCIFSMDRIDQAEMRRRQLVGQSAVGLSDAFAHDTITGINIPE
ncbi:hypothetical protein SDC9_145027 [bioreactor metagenome]|uniref:Uncharacterized protein n=1 Tax=bioreactor metagenome TaxID=1076179 RepID=A0A645E7M0_9ZZZZ